MTSACMSLFYMRLGSPAPVAASQDSPLQAACTPMAVLIYGCRSSSHLSAVNWSVSKPKHSHLSSRNILAHPAFAFNPSEHKPFTVEELEAKIAEGNHNQAGNLGQDSSSQGQASEYKPFSVEELDQKVSQRNLYTNRRQKHKTVSTTFQPLGPDYPPITLEELEADLAQSNYKPFSSFKSKGDDVSSSKPLGSEYKPFTVEELEQKIGKGNYKPFSKQDDVLGSTSHQLSGSQYKPSAVSGIDQGIGDSSDDLVLGQGSKPNSSEFEPLESGYKTFSVEGLDQATGDNTYKSVGNEGVSRLPSTESSSSSSSLEGTGSSSASDIYKTTLPKITALYVGNLSWNYTNQQLDELFKQHGSVFVSEVIFDKITGQSRGFGFVYMSSPEDAEVALRNLDGKEVEGRPLRVRYQETAEHKSERRSSGGGGSGGYGEDTRNVNKLFVANLPWSVDNDTFEKIFSEYGTVIEARIVCDRDTGRSKGYGFVTLSSADEVNSALLALNGFVYDGRALKVAVAGEKPTSRSSIL